MSTSAQLTRRPMRSKRSKGERHDSRDVEVARLLQHIGNKMQIYERRIATRFSLSTDGTGRIAINTLVSSALVSALTDFTKVAGLYLAYRVKAMRATWNPIFSNNVSGVAPSPSTLVSFLFSSGIAAANYQDALDSSGAIQHSGYRASSSASTDWNGLLDAHLWTPTTAAVTAAESYGIAIVEDTSATISQLTTLYYTGVAEYVVEFCSAA